jgi:hypothetical protein
LTTSYTAAKRRAIFFTFRAGSEMRDNKVLDAARREP